MRIEYLAFCDVNLYTKHQRGRWEEEEEEEAFA